MLFSQTITQTLSLNTAQLSSIRNAALNTSDPLIAQYWSEYTRETRNSEEDTISYNRDRNFTDVFCLEMPAIDAYQAVL
jgi:hypothetical protein